MLILWLIVSLASSFIFAIVAYIKYSQNHWKLCNVPYIEPEFPYGNFRGVGKQYHTSELLSIFYKRLKGKGPFGGIYFLWRPVVLALDLDFIKNVLIKDFDHFKNRDIYFNARDDPLSANVLTIENAEWKELRSKLTPSFTSGHMKQMLPMILDVAKELVICLKSDMLKNADGAVELKEILARYTTDIIGVCVMGIHCNSLRDPDAEFRKLGKQVINAPKLSTFQRFMSLMAPTVARFLRIRLFDPNVTNSFFHIIQRLVEFRETEQTKRHDLLDLLIRLKNKSSETNDPAIRKFTLNDVAAQAMIFFLGGFETSSNLLSFCLYELAVNRNVQEKLRNEINEVLNRHNGCLTYDSIAEMTYMNQVINETLRKNPPNDLLSRRVSTTYRIPGTNLTLKKNQPIMIPVYPIHHDPEYYPNPDRFDPERFSPAEIAKRHPMAFLAFGEGPRNCIGVRFGLIQVRVALATLLKDFEFTLSSRVQVPIPISKTTLHHSIDGDLWLNMKCINSNSVE